MFRVLRFIWIIWWHTVRTVWCTVIDSLQRCEGFVVLVLCRWDFSEIDQNCGDVWQHPGLYVCPLTPPPLPPPPLPPSLLCCSDTLAYKQNRAYHLASPLSLSLSLVIVSSLSVSHHSLSCLSLCASGCSDTQPHTRSQREGFITHLPRSNKAALITHLGQSVM